MTLSSILAGQAGDGSEGFSLLEMLIALTLFGLVTVMLFGGLQLGTRVMESGGKRSEQASRLSVASEFLRAQLAQAQPVERTEGERIDGKMPIEFDGAADSVAFVGPTSAYQPVGGLQTLNIYTDRQGGKARLMADWRPYRTGGDMPSDEAGRRSVLFDDVSSVELAYFGALTNKEKPRWRQEWRDQTALPSLVHMRVAFRDGRTSPDLFVALKLAEAR
jgi:general secretion pathway protein J